MSIRTDGDKDKDDDKDDVFDHDAEAQNLREMDAEDDDDEDIEVTHEDDDEPDTLEGSTRKVVDAEEEEEEEDDADKRQKGGKFQKRIDRLTADREAQRERADEAEQRAQESERLLAERDVQVDGAQRMGATTAQAAAASSIASLEGQIEAAIEEGDSKKQAKLTVQLTEEIAKKRQVDAWLARNPEPTPEQRQQQQQRQQQRQEQPKTGRARFVAEARPWYDQNKAWFDKPENTIERAAVQALDGELTKDGFAIDDPDRYRELNKRLYAKFPHLKPGGQKRKEQLRRQRTAGVERDSEGATPRNDGGRSSLTNDDKRLMRTFRLDPANDKHVKQFYREQKRK